MRNRAKCKLCSDIIESLHTTDYQKCSCDQIAIDGGPDNFLCFSRDWANFFRVDDKDVEIPVKVSNSGKTIEKVEDKEETIAPPSKTELLSELQIMLQNIEQLPPHAMHTPVTHYDLYSFMLVVSALFKAS